MTDLVLCKQHSMRLGVVCNGGIRAYNVVGGLELQHQQDSKLRPHSEQRNGKLLYSMLYDGNTVTYQKKPHRKNALDM